MDIRCDNCVFWISDNYEVVGNTFGECAKHTPGRWGYGQIWIPDDERTFETRADFGCTSFEEKDVQED